MLLATDTSKWEDKSYDYPGLAARGIVANTTKATQGTYYKDPLYDYHLAGAKAAGMKSGAFQFFDPDPRENPIGQIQYLMDFVKTFTVKPDYLCLDIEREFYRVTKVVKTNKKGVAQYQTVDQRVSSSDLNARVRQAADELEKHGYPVVYYTRVSWVDEFCPQMWDWLHTRPLILAQYPDSHSYHNLSVAAETKWMDGILKLADTWLDMSVKGVEATNVVMWQFCEHYMCPGMGNDTDLNLIISEPKWDAMFQTQTGEVVLPATGELTIEEKVQLLWDLHPELHSLS